MTKSIILAGIPLLTFPLFGEAGMSRDHAQRTDGESSFSNQQIVQGEISNKKGDEITLRTSSGERITFRMNDQTNQLCPKDTQASQTSSMGKGSSMNQGSSTQGFSGQNQMAQGSTGQDSSTTGQTSSSSLFGSQSGQASEQSSSGMQHNSPKSQTMGFRFGECNFQKGEFVKAKVDENGNATFVRSMGESEEYYATGGVEGEYFVLPAGQLGGLDISDKDAHYSVKTSDGQEIGNVYRIMTNSEGDLTYAIVRKKDGQLISVPWQALEGAGNKSFKMKVTQNQLGNLPILKEGESAGAHVQKHWDLTEQERRNLAKWNERMDDFYQTRDRYYEDTPTFEENREGYDRYDRSRDAQRNRYQDEDRFRQSRYRDNDRDRYRDDRNRQSRDSNRRYPELGSRPGVAGERGRVSLFGSPSTLPPGQYAPQYEGTDRGRSFDDYNRNRQSRESDRRYPELGSRPGVAGERGRVSLFGSPSTLPPGQYAPQYEGADRGRSFDRNRQTRYSDDFQQRGDRGRSMYSHSRERDRYQSTTSPRRYDPQRQGADRYQSRRSGNSNYDDRPEQYRP